MRILTARTLASPVGAVPHLNQSRLHCITRSGKGLLPHPPPLLLLKAVGKLVPKNDCLAGDLVDDDLSTLTKMSLYFGGHNIKVELCLL